MRNKILTLLPLFLLSIFCTMYAATEALAHPSYFTANCAGCHSNDTATCDGCHAHGVWRDSNRTVNNLTASTDLAQYRPGQTVTVTFSGGYRYGWIRAKLYDQSGAEISRITGPTSMGDDGSGSLTQQFPVMMSAPAPSTPGLYRWTAAWFGSPFDKGNSGTFPHVEETVSTNQFEVINPPPVCADADQDGYQDIACNADVTKGGGDCNDLNAAVSPGVAEVAYNGTNDDCDASTPDDDLDGDGFGIASDCDDTDASVNPSAAEVCGDGLDNDCDGLTDADDPDCAPPPPTDADGDGYPADTDCNDNNPLVNPGMTEIPYNGINDDCNSATRDDDLDRDGYNIAEDCNDNNASINPGENEVPYNGIDDDCNASTRDDDVDGDGFGVAQDCNDNNSSVHPGAAEVCGDGLDNDCDGLVDSSDSDCAPPPSIDADGDGYTSDTDCNDNNPLVNPGMTEVPYNGTDDDCNPATRDDDLDGDGYGVAQDCNDNNSSVHPGAAEVCSDGLDNDCDGLFDSNDPDCAPPPPTDADGDGYPADTDCNDNNPLINPGMTEVPYNGINDDCNSATRDDDLDRDGYKIAQDCNDNNASVNPGAAEVCDDGLDNDCDGLFDSNDPDCGAYSLDGQILRLDAPSEVRIKRPSGVERIIAVVMKAKGARGETATGTLYLRENGALVDSVPVALKAGKELRETFNVTITAADAPSCKWEATLEIPVDPKPSNNTATATTKVIIPTTGAKPHRSGNNADSRD